MFCFGILFIYISRLVHGIQKTKTKQINNNKMGTQFIAMPMLQR